MTGAQRRLDGWKQIAAFLERDERTAQRWRQERGLPVHQVPGGLGSVYAFGAELESWMRGERVPADSAEPPEPQPQAAGSARAPRQGWHAAAGAVFLVAGAALLIALADRPGSPVTAVLTSEEVSAVDARGRLAWRCRLPHPTTLVPEFFLPAFGPQARLADVDGDGLAEALVLLRSENGPLAGGELACLSAGGRLLWRYDPGGVALSFSGRRFEGPWNVAAIRPPDTYGGDTLVSVAHHTWWPSFVDRIDSRGAARRLFVHSGSIYDIARWRPRTGGRALLLAAATDNEHAAASLSVLDLNGGPVASPQTGQYACDDCPLERPLALMLFPRSEVNLARGGPYNWAHGLSVSDSSVVVRVTEDPEEEAHAFYEVALPGLALERAWFDDAYWKRHRRLETEGRIDHPAERCPARERPALRVWRPGVGWSG